MRKIFNLLLLSILSGLCCISCQDYYEDGGVIADTPIKMSTLSFIKSRSDLFDTTLIILKRAGLDRVLEEENVTFFAPQNASIMSAMKSINTYVKANKTELGYTKDTVVIDDISNESWRMFMSRYIFKGQKLRDDLPKGKFLSEGSYNWISGGTYINSYDNFQMFCLTEWTTWESVDEAGPKYIHLVDPKDTDVTIQEQSKYSAAKVTTSNLVTQTGVVHVLTKSHVFGFGREKEFILIN